ncbi:LemA family protein [Thiocapsa bogorovii]|uniref:LemA family protein n=1 Tax=Thiocapsa bogorovii TaxID=521689 RepID=UPI001E584ADD|nr:LemA family protein [Thiocapsa bogorovii]UHD17996.1 LemA family protein [Thiocapsa bogorovii]
MVYGLAALLLIPLGWGIGVFNRLVRLRNRVRAAWSDIDVQLTRRHDLIPMLVEAVRGYATHEKTLFEAVAALRTRAIETRSPAELATLEAALEQSVGRLMLLEEAYPDLKASENFLRLQRDLVDVEEHLQYARRFYNGAVRELNDGIQKVPDLLVARLFGFASAEFYLARESERAAPRLEAET